MGHRHKEKEKVELREKDRQSDRQREGDRTQEMAHDTKRLTREESNQPTSPLTQTEQKQLLEELNHSITQGPVLQKTALQQLDSLSTDTLTQLKTFQEEEDNMLQKAAIHRCGVEVISQLANNCPALVTRQSKGEYKGRTVLHILVSNYDLDAVTALLESIEPSKKVPKLMKVKVSWHSCLVFNFVLSPLFFMLLKLFQWAYILRFFFFFF